MSDTAEPLPAWIYENKQGVIIGVTTLLSVLAIVAVILRFKCRFLAQASIALDDWLILLALPFSIAEAICVAYATKDGLGRHVKIISKPALLEGGKLFFTMQIVWAISTSLVKFSILVFYLRVFSVLNYIRFSAWFLIITVACWMVSNAIARGFQCTPISKVWDDSLPGHCLDTVALFVIGSVSDVVLDFLILVLPLPAIVRLQMPLSKKILVAIIFALGGLYVSHRL
ncbi:uncharacterized protein GGS22DRAFT_154240 [Annulohypoxylon maeteangense]|uniref:uncharacterized protein n=1 Tax=Annulohypoxylon maeteangense TaxID=1927788 RepID=UPI00200874BB|nr:uncharacterized protein GGS22DRAFT_154240 [Annulohypoxylon maeteangense]KAI0887771.1 hypothetical protein GGS22DRAFT_154240 [Annulohypoxylon maeteangense]